MSKHKHYYTIRAFADGWEIQCSRIGHYDWWKDTNPYFGNSKFTFRVIPDSEGWLPWYCGHILPAGQYEVIEGGCTVQYSLREEGSFRSNATKYRVIKPVDPYAELKAAAKDPTKEISLKGTVQELLGWHSGDYWNFDLPPEDYEIRDKPKTRKVKLLAYFNGGYLNWCTENVLPNSVKRVPSEDKEVEVEE